MKNISIYTIYNSPKDYPGKYVVREWITQGGKPMPGECSAFPSLTMARNSIPRGLFCTGRNSGDDPVIVETWL